MKKDLSKKQYYNSCGILELWHDVTFDDFTNDATSLKRVKAYADESNACTAFQNGYGLYLYGNNGVGKTHLMMCLLKKLIDHAYNVRSITLGTLIKFYTQEYWHNADNLFSRIIREPHFLEVEEVGKEYKSGETDLGRTVLDTVVRFRLQMKKPILFTSNLKPKDIETVYTHDIASMMQQCCVDISVKGTDWRDMKNSEMKAKLKI